LHLETHGKAPLGFDAFESLGKGPICELNPKMAIALN
jgi:hypothetical protein